MRMHAAMGLGCTSLPKQTAIRLPASSASTSARKLRTTSKDAKSSATLAPTATASSTALCNRSCLRKIVAKMSALRSSRCPMHACA
jgi:hypothetical protein